MTHFNLAPAVLTIVAAVFLSACSVAGPRESPLPKTGPKMIDIYNNHLRQDVDGVSSEQRRFDPSESIESIPVRDTTSNPLNNRFARLPNPDLEMHVYPHLAGGKYPVPGYVTVFPMYESVQYAMPGEMRVRSETAVQPTPLMKSANTEGRSDAWTRAALEYRDDLRDQCGKAISYSELSTAVLSAKSQGATTELAQRIRALQESEQRYLKLRSTALCAPNQK